MQCKASQALVEPGGPSAHNFCSLMAKILVFFTQIIFNIICNILSLTLILVTLFTLPYLAQLVCGAKMKYSLQNCHSPQLLAVHWLAISLQMGQRFWTTANPIMNQRPLGESDLGHWGFLLIQKTQDMFCNNCSKTGSCLASVVFMFSRHQGTDRWWLSQRHK